jgi:glycosyltransferase involved in cell wall biosynthesis
VKKQSNSVKTTALDTPPQAKTDSVKQDPENTKKHVVCIMVNQLGAGGAEQQIVTLVKGIDKRIFQVIVVTLYPGGASEPVVKQVPGVELVCLNRRGKFDVLPIFQILRLLQRKKVDIIQPFLSPATLFALVPASVARTPIKIVTERCGVRNTTHFGYRVLRTIEDYFGHSAQVAVANSLAGQDLLLGRGFDRKKIKVIYNGLNLTRLNIDPDGAARIRAKNEIKPGSMIIGVNAWLWPGKGQDIFLRSARIVHEQRPDVYFALLGDGPFREHLEGLAKELDIDKQVIFFGAQQEVGTYLSLFNIAVTSSIDHEGCSNSILEAMALSKPVVATDIGGNRELVEPGKTGLLIKTGDHAAMAEAILSLINDPELTRRLAENGHAMVMDRFASRKMVQAYQDLWSGLLRDRKKLGGNHD